MSPGLRLDRNQVRALLVVAVVAILVFGMWGPEFNEQNFVYFQF